MAAKARVLVIANRTAATPALLETVRRRALRSAAEFHLVVPATSGGLHRVVDPEDHGREEAEANLKSALPLMSAAAGAEVSGEVGDPNPVSAAHDAFHAGSYDEIIVSTLSRRVSRWTKLDLPSKARELGVPVTHVEPGAVDACLIDDAPQPAEADQRAAV